MSFRDCIFTAVARGKLEEGKAKEALDIFDEVLAEMRAQGASDATAQAGAAKAVSDQVRLQNALRKRQQALTIKTMQRIRMDIEGYRNSKGEKDIGQAVLALLDNDQLASYSSVTQRQKRILGQLHAKFTDALEQYRPRLAGLQRPRAGIENLVREMFGEKTGDEAAAELAAAWRETSDLAKKRANQAGANIGTREDWGLPQHHNQTAIAKVSKQDWVDFTLDRIDWNKTINFDTGRVVPQNMRRETLGKIYDTIKTDGFIKINPRAAGRKSLANAMNNHRFLVFKNANSWLEYDAKFGNGDPFDTMLAHLDHMARQTAMMEILGPNPSHTKEMLKQMVKVAAAETDVANAGPAKKLASQFIGSTTQQIDDLFGVISGQSQAPANPMVAHTFAGLRNLLTSAQLGSAALAAIPGDLATSRVTAKYNGLDATRFLKEYAKMLNPADIADQKLAVRSALIAENWSAVAMGQQRYVGEVIGPAITQRIADVTMRLSGLSPHTQASRWAFGMEFMATLSDNVGKKLSELDKPLKNAMDRYGITSEMWDTMRKTPAYEHEGVKFLRPDDLVDRLDIPENKRNIIADRFMEMIQTEMEFAVPTASARARAFLTGNTRPGTLQGEIARSFAMYKNFPVTIIMTHMRRAMIQPDGKSMARYAASIGISMTMAGAITMQMRELAKGRDPRNMKDTKFWGAAVLQGGGLGIWGDFLFADLNRFGAGKAGTVAGPVTQFLGDTIDLTVGNVAELATGEDTHFGKELVRYMDRNMPGGSIWYLRLATDRLITDELEKMVDPKAYAAFRRREQSAKRDYGQEYWWRPGQVAPSRAPDVTKAIQ